MRYWQTVLAMVLGVSCVPDEGMDDTAMLGDDGALARTVQCVGTEVPYGTDGDLDGWADDSSPDGCANPSTLAAGKSAMIGDCDDNDITIYPGAPETADGEDEDCDGVVDEAPTTTVECYDDKDNDNHRTSTKSPSSDADCDDAGEAYVTEPMGECKDDNAMVNVDRMEITPNGVDDNCNGTVDEVVSAWFPDSDKDGYGNAAGPSSTVFVTGYVNNNADCDDGNGAVRPTASEQCNNKDDDCDTVVDEGLGTSKFYLDVDQDTYGSSTATPAVACAQPAGHVDNNLDCDDAAKASYPGAPEVCDGRDNDCDGTADETCTSGTTWYQDLDGDKFGNKTVSTVSVGQPAGYVADSTDCNDGNAAVNPIAVENPTDKLDNDCDGQVDENATTLTWYPDADRDGYGAVAGAVTAATPPLGYVADSKDCNDALMSVNPGAVETVGDGVDQNCDGREDCYRDLDDDGFRPSTNITLVSNDADCADANEALAVDSGDCNDSDPAVRPGATEGIGDGVDQNCDTFETCYRDLDDDGYYPSSKLTVPSMDADCADANEALAVDSGDCNDSVLETHPNAPEVCDKLDNDCDGRVDEEFTSTTWYLDADKDGYGTSATSVADCSQPTGYVTNKDDCKDSDATIHPGATEVVNDGVDQDCSGSDSTQSGTGPYFPDGDGDGYGAKSSPGSTTWFSGSVTNNLDCDDVIGSINPSMKDITNGFDDDCDGVVDGSAPPPTGPRTDGRVAEVLRVDLDPGTKGGEIWTDVLEDSTDRNWYRSDGNYTHVTYAANADYVDVTVYRKTDDRVVINGSNGASWLVVLGPTDSITSVIRNTVVNTVGTGATGANCLYTQNTVDPESPIGNGAIVCKW